MPGILFTMYSGLQVSDILRISDTSKTGSRRNKQSYGVPNIVARNETVRVIVYVHVLNNLRKFRPDP